MRRTVVLTASWLAVAVVAVALAWQGVSVVGNQVTDERPPPLAASDIAQRLEDGTTTSTTAPETSGTTVAPAATTSTSAAGALPGSSPAPTTTTAPAAPSPTPPPPAGETRTYNLVGGTASLRFEPSGVTVLFANPASGFSVSVEPEHGNGVSVEFESEGHESRVDGWWDGGPVDRVREEPDAD